MSRKKQGRKEAASSSSMDLSSPDTDIRSIMRDIESFVSSKHMTWKEKKELENKKVVSLGGKPVKKQRLPLSVARVQMKKQKQREQKMLQESAILGRFGTRFNGEKRSVDKRRPEDRVLKSTAGNFRNGILDVKHMLKPAPSASRDGDGGSHGGGKVPKRKGGKKNKGKKGGGRKRH
ncbi:hypothetical protein DCAR_0935919 [Daucus carota subsp. sativus]|uniref:Uncharacterized protein n=2 Tax=Daucus carota subsp. sativus TaxID=79200 RepID=A0A175YKL9_DAUCS|nr:hypothetical protein DCAR_0935919 [Daucus carota subsp. sativus]